MGSPNAATVKYERERIAAGLGLAQAAAKRMRQFMAPGVTDSVASMLESDLEQAVQRIEWLRDRERQEREAAA